jgi:MoxR-like ATPase
MEIDEASRACQTVVEEVGAAVVADRTFFDRVLLAVLARGHVLLEDVPGTGKTLTARSIATALGLDFSRVQFTPDLLPADMTGTNVFDESTGEFTFSPGPIFANVVLADEINRAPPKTQAALLEAMEERQVTVDGETHELPTPFIVIATQNPVESEGAFPLPEAQLDRFLVKTTVGYPDRDGELELLYRRSGRSERSPSVESVLDRESVLDLRRSPERIRVDDDLYDYMVDLARATRTDRRVEVGVSPRGTQRLFEAARARAVIAGREYVTPDDVVDIVDSVFAHRLILTPDAAVRDVETATVIAETLDSIPVPTIE